MNAPTGDIPIPGHIALSGSGRLTEIAESLKKRLVSCDLCPRKCNVDRTSGELGACKTSDKPTISSYGPHYGEESVLVGRNGSGTIFFSGCNLGCVFCQNYEISQMANGRETSCEHLAEIMLELQKDGCHNINLVTPTHQIHAIIQSLALASSNGLKLPVVYNCGGYESVDVISEISGAVDIYMPDAKYGSNEAGLTLSGVPDYVTRLTESMVEMHNQTGDLEIFSMPDVYGGYTDIAVKGMLVRHLVLPNDAAKTNMLLDLINNTLGRNTYLNIMDQYHPAYKSKESIGMDRTLKAEEFESAIKYALGIGLTRLDTD